MNVACPECRSVFRVDPAKVPAGGVRARCSVCGAVMMVDAPTTFGEDAWAPAGAGSAAGAGSVAGAPTPAYSDRQTPPPRAATPSSSPSPSPWPGPAQGSPPHYPAVAGAGMGSSMSPGLPATPTRETPPGPPAVGLPGMPTPVVATSAVATPAAAAPSIAAPTVAAPVMPSPPTGGPRVGAPTPVPSRPAMGGAAPSGERAPINPFLANDPNQKAKRLARALVSDIVAYHPQQREQGLRDGTLRQLFKDEIKKSYEEYVEQVGSEFAESTAHFQDALNDILASGRKMF